MEFYIAGFVFGIVGSFHCAAMCGPIMLAIPVSFKTRIFMIFDLLLYNSGRILTYGVIGGILSFVNKPFVMFDLQQSLSIITGLLILIFYFLPLKSKSLTNYSFLKKAFSNLINSRSKTALFFLGTLNGLLPCGFVYMAAMGAILSSSFSMGVIYMIFFGLGTLPMLLLVAMTKKISSVKIKTTFSLLKPYLVVAFALLFIIRGMGLDLPFLSPMLQYHEVEGTFISICH